MRKAATRSLTYGCFSYKCVRDILENGLDLKTDLPQPSQAENPIKDHENIRGKEYYH